jgi:hypothetical protein
MVIHFPWMTQSFEKTSFLQMTTTSQQSFSKKHWTTVITPHGSVFHIPWRELWEYRDLIYRFVHRDFVSRYKQTIFGSLWYVLQPLFTSQGTVYLWHICASMVVSIVVVFFGLALFDKLERTCVDMI